MKDYLRAFLREKPLFFAFLRPKEASLYRDYKPFKGPVLDLGCGDGFFAQVAFGNVDVGIDPDKKAVAEAKRRKIYKVVKYYDGKKIPYPNNYFSTILCNSTFEHISNLDEVLSEVARVLKADGVLYFTAPTDKWPNYLLGYQLFGQSYASFFNKIQKHNNLFNYNKWQKKLRRLNLNIIYSTHYLDNKKVIRLFDLAHYLSIFSLITKFFLNRWVIFPNKVKYLGKFEQFVVEQTSKDSESGSCLFIAAKKV